MGKLLLSLFVLLSLMGCKGDGWGDKFKAFVENDVSTLSRAYAESQFSKKWSNAFRDQMVFSNEQLLQTADLALAFEFTGPPENISTLSEPELIALYLSQLNAAAILNEMDALAFTSQDAIQQAGAICDNSAAFYLFDLNNEALRGMFAMTKPEENETYYLGSDMGELVAFWVGELIGRSEYKEQSRAFQSGMNMLPKKIIHDEALFVLSSEICHARVTSILAGIKGLVKSFTKLRLHFAVQRQELTAAISLSEYYVLKIGRKRLKETYGITTDIVGHLAFVEKEQIERGLVAAFFEWLKFGNAVQNEADPLRKLLLEEEYKEMTRGMMRDLDWLQGQTLAQSSRELIALQRPLIQRAQQ